MATKRLALACVLALTPALAMASTHAAPADVPVVVTGYTYFPGDEDLSVVDGDLVVTALVLPSGTSVVLRNADVNLLPHSMTADELGPNGFPLFDSDLVPTNGTKSVTGVASLAPGVYGFHCRLHDWRMHGYLQIT